MKTKYPMILKDGAAEVKVSRINDHGREAFLIEYYWGGSRRRKTRADEKTAHADARKILAMILDETPKFSDTEGAVILKNAECALVGLRVPVDVAAREYANAMKELGDVSLAKAVAEYLKHRPDKSGKLIPELVDEYLAALKPDVSVTYFVNTRAGLFRFARRFPGRLSALTKSEIEGWIRDLNLGKRARNNTRATVVAFSRWARLEGYLPRGVEVEAALIKKLDAPTIIKIMSLPDVARLFDALENGKGEIKPRPDLIPYAAMATFAGIRPHEVLRLTVGAIRWNHNDIEIPANKAKTKTRRLVKIHTNLAKWLAPLRGASASAKVAPVNADEKLTYFAKSIGIEWSNDVLRHSFVSYAVGMLSEVGKVALWAGNSEAIIKKHYLERVTEEEGRAFFEIGPKRENNVVHFKAA